MRNKVQFIIVVASVVLVGALLVPALSPGLALQEDTDDGSSQRTVSVRGSGQVSAQPDTAVVTLGVQTEAEEAATALTENSQQMQALVAVLQDAGIPAEDIQTQAVRLYPRYEDSPSSEGQRELAGYTATNIVQVQMRDLDAVGETLDAAVQAGGNRIQGIRFEVSDPATYLDQAREAAWSDAQHKAEHLAGLAELELGEVLTINESGTGPQPVVERALMADTAAAVPIEPGSQTIEVDLQITWNLR
ncbi:MAG: SIMPL domain-containing protein [Anaerolineae bacterium]|jgi:uncharacterized protein YggE